jgi:hypothetical protein
MNPVALQIEKRLTHLPDEYRALKEHALKYLQYCSAIDLENTLLVGHMPWVGPLAYAINLFPPAKESWFEKFRSSEHKNIPKVYRAFLRETNGCFVHGLSLFGLAPSMQGSPPVLAREKLQCHDLSLANQDWIGEYAVEKDQFLFGGRAFSDNENIGYFFGPLIRALRKNGEVLGEWSSFSSFLRDELPAAERLAEKTMSNDWWH